MTLLNDDQINSLDKNAMTFIIKTLQGQLALLETTNKKLAAQLESSEKAVPIPFQTGLLTVLKHTFLYSMTECIHASMTAR